MAKTSAVLSWVGLAVLCAACSDPKPEPQTADDVESSDDKPAAKKAKTAKTDGDTGDDSGPVTVDDRISKMCSLPTASFDYNSAQVASEARSVLDALAACFSTGPGKDKGLNIVGHADPRGETEFNFGLGQRRAASVGEYLVRAGVSDARVATSSRGEIEATGTDESGWARDRRVEIFLAE